MKADPIGFVREQIVLADGRTVGEGLLTDPWIEQEMLRPAFAKTDDGKPRYRLVYTELPRGHWKSGGVAAIAVADAALHPSTDVVVAAADREQAAIVLENVDGYLARNPELGALFQRRGDERYTNAGSRIRVISSDAATAFGLGGTHRRFRVICDELTIWPSDALWIALASASGKVEDAQILVLSNAGFEAQSSWQWEIRKTADESDFGHLFSADGPIASWITPHWIEQMRELLPGAAFDRLVSNVWATASGDFVTEEQWRRCIDERLSPRTRGLGTPHFGGLDLGLTRDRTALAIVHRDGDDIVLDELTVWQGTRDDPVSIVAIERALLDSADRFPGLEIQADPWQLKGSIERLRNARLPIREFTFSSSSVGRLSASLHGAISSAALRVFADDELTREILGLRVVETNSGWRFDHRTGGYSDRAVALAMALMGAQRVGRPRPMRSYVPRGRIPVRSGTRDGDRRELAARLGVPFNGAAP